MATAPPSMPTTQTDLPRAAPATLPASEFRVVLVYALLASVWVLLSDAVLDHLEHDPVDTVSLQSWKGLNFVLTTTLLLYWVLKRRYQRWHVTTLSLQESEQRFAYAARASTDAIWDWNLLTNHMWWSDGFYELFGYARDEVRPDLDSWTSRLHPDDQARSESGLLEALNAGRSTWADEYRFRRKDGSYAYVRDCGFVLRDPAGKPIRMVGGMSDITPRKVALEKLNQSHRQLRALSGRLESLREEERSRIAREIHDELGQMLTGLKMDLRWIETRLASHPDPALHPVIDKVLVASELADATIQSIQKIAAELRPALLDTLGLSSALRHEAEQFQSRSGIPCHLQTTDPWLEPSRDTALAAFRVCQEALTNVARHAEATQVAITLQSNDHGLLLTVTDNGKGIPATAFDSPQSLGLLGMQERAALLSGQVTLSQAKPSGTCVTLQLPRTSAPLP